MHVLVIGAAGMVGRKLIDPITRMTLHDVVEPSAPPDASVPVETCASDFSEPGEAEKLVAGRPDVIFHLAAIVSAEAEAEFDKGYRITLYGTRRLLQAGG